MNKKFSAVLCGVAIVNTAIAILVITLKECGSHKKLAGCAIVKEIHHKLHQLPDKKEAQYPVYGLTNMKVANNSATGTMDYWL